MRAFLPRLPLLLLPVALFLAAYPASILDIANAGWLIRGTDNGENALGMHAWLHDPAPGLLRTRLIAAPDGAPLLFTDSNPLLALLLRPFATLLPADAQVVGLWLLACLALQVFFAWLLLKRFAPSPLALWCGVTLLAALPTLFNRYVHANLMAHWLILWALWRFLDARRAGSNLGWAPLILLAALIHNYLLILVGAIWASAMLERFVAAGADWRRRGVLVAGGAAILAAIAAAALLLGAAEPHIPAGNYGAFAMPLDALWNPGNEAFSRFLPSIEQRPGRGFEGFQYLGLGVLLMLAAALIVARRCPAPPAEREARLRLRWLVPALAVLTLLAIGNRIDFAGVQLARPPLPAFLIPALDMVRASGRLFWPVAYVLVLVGILVLYRLPPRRAGMWLAALLAVQMIDISGIFSTVRSVHAEASGHRLYVRTLDPRWGHAIRAARDVAFEPSDVTLDLALFQEVAWRAAGMRRPVRTAYLARDPLAMTARLAREHRDFFAGRLDPRRLYILGASTPVPPAARARLAVLDGVRVLLPEG